MVFNYLKIAFRTIRKKPVFSFVNIGGLSIGFACVLLLYLYVSNQFGYDEFFEKSHRTYRLFTRISLNGKENRMARSSEPLGPALKQHFPEVETYTNIGYNASYNVRYKDKVFREYRVYTADSNYFRVFDFKQLAGDAIKALANPSHAVITQSIALKYFGNEDPLGKQILLNDTMAVTVSAIMEDYPEKTYFNADILLSILPNNPETSDNWLALGVSTFVVLEKGTTASDFERKIKPFTDKYTGPQIEKLVGVPLSNFKKSGNDFQFHLQPLEEIYLYSKEKYQIDPNTEWGSSKLGNITYVRIFIAVAIFILLIAAFNFINLTTATSESRGKEVGIRKTLGSNRKSLIIQFLLEALLFTLISVVIAFFIAGFLLPWYNQLLGLSLSFSSFLNSQTAFAVILFVCLTGLLAGIYPAFFLSAFNPTETLKGVVKRRKASLRSVLVVSQFAISIALISGMMAIRKQLDYLQKLDMGFDKEQLFSITNGSALGETPEAFRQELLKDPGIHSVTFSSLMLAAGVPESGYSFEGNIGAEPVMASFLDVDDHFLNTFKLQLLQGRFFDASMKTDSQAVVINESAMYAFRASFGLDKKITNLSNDSTPRNYRIIGIVKDFHFESLHQRVKPLVLHLGPVRQPAVFITVRFKEGKQQQVLSTIEKAWQSSGADGKCNISFLSDRLSQLYREDKKVSEIAAFLSGLAIFIASMGLFGLAMFVHEQRTKEIGIRKVLGATVLEVVLKVSGKFALWIGLANLLAWPVAYIVIQKWLQQYAYRVEPGIGIFLFAGFITMVIAMATVAVQSTRAAIDNPLKSLRSE